MVRSSPGAVSFKKVTDKVRPATSVARRPPAWAKGNEAAGLRLTMRRPKPPCALPRRADRSRIADFTGNAATGKGGPQQGNRHQHEQDALHKDSLRQSRSSSMQNRTSFNDLPGKRDRRCGVDF